MNAEPVGMFVAIASRMGCAYPDLSFDASAAMTVRLDTHKAVVVCPMESWTQGYA
eukprot:SAG11_NODE_22062_length_413_cov_0.573248_1_plen_55_part_00